MTATPVRTDGQNMIEKRCGDVTYELKISDAVARGILKLPIYITARYMFEEDIRNIEARLKLVGNENIRKELEEKLNSAKKQLENAAGLKEIFRKYLEENGKYLAFCNPGDNLEEIIEKAKREGWFDETNKNQTLLSIEASKQESENNIALRQFLGKKGKDLRILLSKNMLNEGIHDEELTGEIMLRPTKSYILFIQQLGRILSRDREKSPLVLDLVNNIHYFKEFRLEVQRLIKEAEVRGDKRYDSKVLEQFRIIEEQEEFIRAFEEIEDAINGYINRTVVSRTLGVARILKANGVDLSEIQLSSTKNKKTKYILLGEIEQDGIDIGKIIEESGLDPEFPYGKRVILLRTACNNKGWIKITEEERQEARELGLLIEGNKSVVAQTLEVAKVLKANGVDLNKIKLTRIKNKKYRFILLGEIKQEGIDIGRIIEENGLDPKFPYGQRVTNTRKAYFGAGSNVITEEERQEVREAGLVVEDDRSAVQQALEIAKVLKLNGVDLSRIQITRKKNGKVTCQLLGEIEQEGIDIGKIIEENGLDPEFPYGQRISGIRLAYNGKGCYKITEAEKQEVRELGILSEDSKSVVTQILEIARVLKANGVDLNKIKLTKSENRKPINLLLGEIEQEGIDIGKIIEENGLNPEFPYGVRFKYLKEVYKNGLGYKMTEEERSAVAELGIVINRRIKAQEIGQASFDAPVEACDNAQITLENLIDNQRREGGITQGE